MMYQIPLAVPFIIDKFLYKWISRQDRRSDTPLAFCTVWQQNRINLKYISETNRNIDIPVNLKSWHQAAWRSDNIFAFAEILTVWQRSTIANSDSMCLMEVPFFSFDKHETRTSGYIFCRQSQPHAGTRSQWEIPCTDPVLFIYTINLLILAQPRRDSGLIKY